jgi:ribonuclease HI
MRPDEGQINKLRDMNRKVKVSDPVFMTGYSDASFKESGEGSGSSWGIWVRDHKTRILRANVCPEWVVNSCQAEACGVWAAIHTALTHLDTKTGNILVIKTDCQAVARFYGWEQSSSIPNDSDTSRIVVRAYRMAQDYGVKLIVKWVKGHQSGNTLSGYLNHRVDRLANKARTEHQQFKIVLPMTEAAP